MLVSLQMILHTSMKSMSNQGERNTHTYEESRCQDQLILLFHFDVFIVSCLYNQAQSHIGSFQLSISQESSRALHNSIHGHCCTALLLSCTYNGGRREERNTPVPASTQNSMKQHCSSRCRSCPLSYFTPSCL